MKLIVVILHDVSPLHRILPFRKLCHPILVCASYALLIFAPSAGDAIVGRLWFALDTVAMPALMVSQTVRGICNLLRDWKRVSSEALRDVFTCL